MNQLSFSIIIPVLNESASLRGFLRALISQITPKDEIIVVDGGSQDETAAIAADFTSMVFLSPRPGRAHQMNFGSQKAKGDILVFLHADTFLPDSWRPELERAWGREPQPSLAAFDVSFDQPNFYLKICARLANWRARKWTGVPHGDQAVSVSRKNFLKVGGYPNVALMEEYYLADKLKGMGPKYFISTPVVTSSRRYQENGMIYNNLRNLLILFLFRLGVSSNRLAKLYR